MFLLVYFIRIGIASEEWAWTRFIPQYVKVQIISVVKLSDTNSHSSHILLDVLIANKDNKIVPQMKAVINQLMSVGVRGSEDMMVKSVIEYLPYLDGCSYDFSSVGYEMWRSIGLM